MRRWLLAAGILTVAGLVGPLGALPADAAALRAAHQDVVGYVDPLIGSSNGGRTPSGAVRPFGMLFVVAHDDQGRSDRYRRGQWLPVRHDADARIRTDPHADGAGCHPGAAGDVPIFPHVGAVTSSPTANTDATYASDFFHADEVAKPGRYSLGLANGTKTDFAATTRAGIGTISFPKGKQANLLFRTSNSLNGSENAQTRINAKARTVSGSVLTGGFCGRRGNGGGSNKFSYYRLYFTATLTSRSSAQAPGSTTGCVPAARQRAGAKATRRATSVPDADRAATWDSTARSPVTMKVGISYTSAKAARANLRAEVEPGATVKKVATVGTKIWNQQLRRVEVAGGSRAKLTTFYTSLYHSFLQPNITSDVARTYLGADRKVRKLPKSQGAQYGNFCPAGPVPGAHATARAARAGDRRRLRPVAAQPVAAERRRLEQGDHVQRPHPRHDGDPTAPTLAGMNALGVDNFEVKAAFDSLVEQTCAEQGRPVRLRLPRAVRGRASESRGVLATALRTAGRLPLLGRCG